MSIKKSRILLTLLNYRSILFVRRNTLTYKTHIRQLFNDGINIEQQTVEVNPVEHIRRCSLHKNDDIWTYYKTKYPNVRTLGDSLNEGYTNSNDGPCIGVYKLVNTTNALQWLSYSQVIERCQFIGSYLWTHTKLIPMHSKVSILSSNRPEYLFAEQACYQYGFIVISLYTNYDSATILSVLRRTQTEVLFVDSIERIRTFQDELFANNQLKEIIIMNDGNYEENSKIRSLSTIFKWMKKDNLAQRPKVDPDSIATFVLTSGTTGEPKIAMLSHENLLATAKNHIIRLEKANIKRPLIDRHCSFLPMAHVYERFILLQIFLNGTQVVFCPEPDQLPHYLSIVKPTQTSVVPRVLNKVYDAIMTEVNKSYTKKFLVQQALRQQLPFLSSFVFRKVRNIFGNEIKVMITAAAPITPEVMHFFRIALNIPIMEGYGQTESAGTGTSTHPIDISCGTIGTPTPAVEIKLVDVAGTDYKSELNRGEICIRGPTVFKGYYDDEEKTREILDKDGWLHTGDVGEWTKNGTLRIIDRTKHIFKLSQGKFVAPERLEDIYNRSRWVAQIFVDAISTKDSVIAIVVPDEQYVRKHFPLRINKSTLVDLCQDTKLKQIILSDLKQIARASNLKTYETINNIHLHPELFSPDNGLLTVTLKTRRTNARKKFQSIIEVLYESNAQDPIHSS